MIRFFATVLLVAIASLATAQDLPYPLVERPDGSVGYVVQEADVFGQWGIAKSDAHVWVSLVSVNPQLADPDLIVPGDTLSVPPAVVGLYAQRIRESSPPLEVIAEATSPEPFPADYLEVPRQELAWALIGLSIIAMGVLIAVWLYRDAARRRNPYTGRPVVEGGLGTPELAAQHFTQRYREERRAMSYGQNEVLRQLVTIDRIDPGYVRGSLQVEQDRPGNYVQKDFREWTRAYRAILSDGGVRYSLVWCGNDVRTGGGMRELPNTQWLMDADRPADTTPHQVWPVTAETPGQPTPEPVQSEPRPVRNVPDDLPVYREVKVTGPRRFVCHPADNRREEILSLAPRIQGITFSIDDGLIIVSVKGEAQVIGRIDPDATDTLDLNEVESEQGQRA